MKAAFTLLAPGHDIDGGIPAGAHLAPADLVRVEQFGWGSTAFGTREALIESGICTANHFPTGRKRCVAGGKWADESDPRWTMYRVKANQWECSRWFTPSEKSAKDRLDGLPAAIAGLRADITEFQQEAEEAEAVQRLCLFEQAAIARATAAREQATAARMLARCALKLAELEAEHDAAQSTMAKTRPMLRMVSSGTSSR
jgi:hypothetical protein